MQFCIQVFTKVERINRKGYAISSLRQSLMAFNTHEFGEKKNRTNCGMGRLTTAFLERSSVRDILYACGYVCHVECIIIIIYFFAFRRQRNRFCTHTLYGSHARVRTHHAAAACIRYLCTHVKLAARGGFRAERLARLRRHVGEERESLEKYLFGTKKKKNKKQNKNVNYNKNPACSIEYR